MEVVIYRCWGFMVLGAAYKVACRRRIRKKKEGWVLSLCSVVMWHMNVGPTSPEVSF